MTEYGTIINNQLIRRKTQHEGDKPIIYADIPTQDFVCAYAWEERADGIYQVWTITDEPIEHEEQHGYTAEQLEQMTTAELKAICTELGISTYMDAENMITLIIDKQKGENI